MIQLNEIKALCPNTTDLTDKVFEDTSCVGGIEWPSWLLSSGVDTGPIHTTIIGVFGRDNLWGSNGVMAKASQYTPIAFQFPAIWWVSHYGFLKISADLHFHRHLLVPTLNAHLNIFVDSMRLANFILIKLCNQRLIWHQLWADYLKWACRSLVMSCILDQRIVQNVKLPKPYCGTLH